MRERVTARVLLFDAAGRLLLMKGRFAGDPDGAGAWFTIGGGVKPGETLEACARREIAEETGIAEVRLGPPVWTRKAVYAGQGEAPVRFLETYFLAWCAGGEPAREGWDAAERTLIDDIRWWTPDELAASTEPVFPEGLPKLLAELQRGAGALRRID
jgi:8-oxo-dGTP pyrophosphatase MutT (NUDIX family)